MLPFAKGKRVKPLLATKSHYLFFFFAFFFIPTITITTENSSVINNVDNGTSGANQTVNHLTIPNHHHHHHYCICDKNIDLCDLECCCDLDCNEYQKLAFQKCSGKNDSDFDPGIFSSCFMKNLPFCLWKDNTGLVMENGKFSPIIDNVTEKTFTTNNRHSIWFWNVSSSSMTIEEKIPMGSNKFIRSGEFRSGQSIVRFTSGKNETNGTVPYYWSLPYSTVISSNSCNQKKRIRYLYDFQSICSTIINNETCTDDYFQIKDAFLGGIPKKHSAVIDSNGTNRFSLILPTPMIDISKSYFDSKLNICHNLIVNIEYIIYHMGIDGIYNVKLRLNKIDQISIDHRRPVYIKKKFNVTFVWISEDKEKSIFKNQTTNNNSSNNNIIGYQFARSSLIFSINLKNVTKNLNFIDSIQIDGHCPVDRKNIQATLLFGINRFGKCQMKIGKDSCEKIQSKIYRFISYHDQLFVGSLERSGKNNSQWIPIRDDDDHHHREDNSTTDTCRIVTGISYQFHYISIGRMKEINFYQIIAARRQVATTAIIPTKSEVVDLSIAVNFFDQSLPMAPRYGMAPSVRIELPEDFFYPFTATRAAFSGCGPTGHGRILLILIPVIFFSVVHGHGI